MKVPFEKDNPFISISTCFLSTSDTLASAYRETSSCSSQSCSFLVLSNYSSTCSNRKTISLHIHTNEQTRICVCMHFYMHIRIYLYAHTRILICTYANTYTHIREYLYAHRHIFMRTYAYSYSRIMRVFWLTYI